MILTNSQWILNNSGIDSWISLNPDSHWFLMILADSWWFSNKSGIDSHWFLKKSKPWFSLILTDSRFSPILDDSWISLELILIDSQIRLNPDSHQFSMILADSQWFSNNSGIDSCWFSNKSKPWFSLILSVETTTAVCMAMLHHFTKWFHDIMTENFSEYFLYFFLLSPTASILNHKQGAILKLRISSFQPCINYDSQRSACANWCKSVESSCESS